MKSKLLPRTFALGAAALTALAAIAMPGNISQAAVIASESFTYADGNLVGKNGGTGFVAAWGDIAGKVGYGNATIVSGKLVMEKLVQPEAVYFRGLTTAFGSSGEIWLSFDFQNTTQPVGSSGGIGLLAGTTEVFSVGSNGSSSNWMISRGGSSARTEARDSSNNAISTQTSMMTGVVKLVLGNNENSAATASLWVGQVGTAVDVSGTPAAEVGYYSFIGVNAVRVSSGGNSKIANFRMADTYADLALVP